MRAFRAQELQERLEIAHTMLREQQVEVRQEDGEDPLCMLLETWCG